MIATNSWLKRFSRMALYIAIGAFCLGTHVLIVSSFVSAFGDTMADAAPKTFAAIFGAADAE